MSQYVDHADENMLKGDYYNAIVHYKKAMQLDSSSVLINWKIAEAYRKYKDYKMAEYYYNKVYRKEDAKIYPYSIFWLATLQKINGNYSDSKESWRSAKRKYTRDRKSYLYKKSLQEYKSIVWAIKAIKDTMDVELNDLPGSVNSYDSEFAPVFRDSLLIFTSMKGDSVDQHGIVHYSDKYRLELFKSLYQEESFGASEAITSLNSNEYHSANGCWTKSKDRFYFTRCDDSLRCKIYVAKYDGKEFSSADVLGEVINDPEANTTMPHIAYKEDKEFLIFVSDREGGQGGLDLWHSEISKGNQYKKPKNFGKKINTFDDEITPFYDPIEEKLYFSSTWHEGFGGMDIFYSTVDFTSGLSTPVNLGLPYNSTYNDTYYYKDIEMGIEMLSSNRTGTLSQKSPNCCNDIFWVKPEDKPVIVELTEEETLEELNKRLPVTLYFHNDEPNPKTKDTTTRLNYLETYYAYSEMKNEYQKEYSKGLKGEEAEEAIEDIDEFYVDFIDQGVSDLRLFTKLLIQELDKGIRIKMNVKGFASPLAQSDYNVKLTMRRIASLVNYLREYEGGSFIPYLEGSAKNGGKLEINGIPFGEYRADRITSDNFHDQRNSVYSRAAMRERKIEIQSIQLLDDVLPELETNKNVHDFGFIKEEDELTHTFTLTNKGKETVILSEIELPCECVKVEANDVEIEPGKSIKIKVMYTPKGFFGLQYKDITIKTNGIPEYITLTITAEIIK